jgi:imidazolonepropionase-like amidohydrolase
VQVALHLRGRILPDEALRDVFVVDGKITFDQQDDAETIFDDGYLLPGLVDAHAHLALFSPAGEGASPEERARASLVAQLDAGVLTVREPGSPDNGSLSLRDDGALPRIQCAGRFLAPSGRYFPGLAREVTEDELPGAGAEELASSGTWVKVIGDFFTPDGFTANWRPETLAEVARRVHDGGGRIAIHAVLPDVIEAAIEASFDSIEHGTVMTRDHIAEMRKRNIAYVPTMIIADGAGGMIASSGIPEAQARMVADAFAHQGERVAEAVDAGVTVLAGTDAGMGPHGMIREEIGRLVAAGVPRDVALGAGSWTARTYLGYPLIEDGAPADIIAFRDDPREALGKPDVTLLGGVRR